MRYFVTIDGEEHVIDVAELPGGHYDVRVAQGNRLNAEIIARDGLFTMRVEGRVLDLVIDGELPELEVFASGHRASVKVESDRMRAAASVRGRGPNAANGVVTSPMPGKVVKLLVKEGDEVAEGAPIVVVEAMKMENELISPRAGVVQKVFVAPGDAVEGGARLVTIG
jgi:biotin carboxyl carrier protein